MKEKTCKELFNEFKQKFTTDQVNESRELGDIYAYFQNRCSMANGNYIHTPNNRLVMLIEKHMGHTYINAPRNIVKQV